MNPSNRSSVRFNQESDQEHWTDKDSGLLQAELHYLRFCDPEENNAVRRINAYYAHMNRQLIRYCKNRLLPDLRKKSAQTVRITAQAVLCYNENGVLSLYTDVTERSHVGSYVARFGDAWNLMTGYPLSLSSFFSNKTVCMKMVKAFMAGEARAWLDRVPGYCFDPGRKLRFKLSSNENYYVTPEGLVLLYPLRSAASRVEAVLPFTMKWDVNGPAKPLSVL
jgi:hypothetical protein